MRDITTMADHRYESKRERHTGLRGRPAPTPTTLALMPLALAALIAVAACLLGPVPARAAGLLVADGGFGGVLEIEEHNVAVTINNGVAVTEVEQVFRNTERRQVEALYVFPVPKGASVANFSMWIGGKEMVGEVLEKKRARQIYESYKQVRRDPGLLEQVDYKTFEMRIFPIGPEARQRVRLTYYQELDFDNDWATYVYPLATVAGGRSGLDSRVQGRFSLSLDARSEVPIAEMTSSSHRGDFVVVSHTPNVYEASLEASGGDLGRDVVLAFRTSRPKTGIDLLTSRSLTSRSLTSQAESEDGFFLLTLTVGEELATVDRGADYVFLLDISGSMDKAGKLDLSRDAIGAFVAALGAEDRFEILTFNVSSGALFNTLRAADGAALREAEAHLGSQQARGGTRLEPALRAAYRYKAELSGSAGLDRPLNVVLLSDGMTEQKERATLVRLIGERPENTRVFCIGIGNEVNQAMLEQLAKESGGLAAFLSRGDDFQRAAAAFRRKLTRPVATDVRVEIDGAEVYDLEPPELGNLFHGTPLRLYGRYREAGPANLTLSAEIEGMPFERALQIELPERDDENPEIERMWAWHRVQRLLEEADSGAGRDAVVDEIVRLGEGFSIVTEYTSFLVLENDAEYKRWQIERRNALRFERDRAAQRRLREELDRIRSRAEAELGPQPEEQRAKREPAARPGMPREPQPPQVASREAPQQPQGQRSRGWDLDMGGGGALDPLSAVLMAALGLAALALRRRS